MIWLRGIFKCCYSYIEDNRQAGLYVAPSGTCALDEPKIVCDEIQNEGVLHAFVSN